MIRLFPGKDLHRSGLVARTFALREVALAQLSAGRTKPFLSVAADQAAQITIQEEDSADALLIEEGAQLIARVRFTVTGRQAEEVLVQVAGQFDLRYERMVPDAQISQDDAMLFSRVNGIYNAWPYAREVVANTLVRLGYPPFTMESLVIAPQPDEAKAAAKP